LAPTQITTTTGLNTFHKPKSNDATTLKASFKKSLLTLKHVTTLANNHLHKHMRPIFRHQHCTLTDPESGVKNEFLIGHGSNNPWFLSAENVPIEVAGTLACLVDTSSMEVPHCYCSGPFFMATNITGTTTLVLQEGTSNKVVHLPLTLLIPFDINDTTKGTITESTPPSRMEPFGPAASSTTLRPTQPNSSAAPPRAYARPGTTSVLATHIAIFV
jgi:hypothetical protein